MAGGVERCGRADFVCYLPIVFPIAFSWEDWMQSKSLKCLKLLGEPAGTRTQDHLIKSLPVWAFFLTKSMISVPNFKAEQAIIAALKAEIWEP
jgi:hypothetical protein